MIRVGEWGENTASGSNVYFDGNNFQNLMAINPRIQFFLSGKFCQNIIYTLLYLSAKCHLELAALSPDFSATCVIAALGFLLHTLYVALVLLSLSRVFQVTLISPKNRL